MIPRSLLTTFLSLKITTTTNNPGPPPDANHPNVNAPAYTQRVDVHTPYHVPEVHHANPAQEVQYDVKFKETYHDRQQQQQQPLTVGASGGDLATTESHTFPVRERS